VHGPPPNEPFRNRGHRCQGLGASKYEISSKNIRTDEGIIKGYTAADLFDAWGRYLPPAPVRVTSNATSATALQPCARCGEPLAEMDLLAKATTHHDCQMAARR
jgi:hypothetical protein